MRSIHLTILSFSLLGGCAIQPVALDSEEVPSATSACLDRLSGHGSGQADSLDANGFSIVNWNIHKGKHKRWADDLQQLRPGADLLILQEAPKENDSWEDIAPGHYRSFAEGFGLSRSVTGVMTISSVAPLAECDFVAYEPWLSTRKATLITEYALTGTAETLLVVNTHSINFSLGVTQMQKQLRQAAAVIEHHDGPVLLSGDLNTWRGRRAEVVGIVVERLGLVPLAYEADHRKRLFGHTLDHIFVRGLRALHATSVELESSDHNPMVVRFSYRSEPRGVEIAP